MSNLTKNKISVYMTDEFKQLVKKEATNNSMTVSAFIITLINNHLNTDSETQQIENLIYKYLDNYLQKPTQQNKEQFIKIIDTAYQNKNIYKTNQSSN